MTKAWVMRPLRVNGVPRWAVIALIDAVLLIKRIQAMVGAGREKCIAVRTRIMCMVRSEK